MPCERRYINELGVNLSFNKLIDDPASEEAHGETTPFSVQVLC
jgi:hypothetical protein